jgi:hypothetical protein
LGLRELFAGLEPRVARELGHSTTKLVEEIYGHVSNSRHSSAVVEYRVAQHRAKLRSHLKLLKTA